MKYSVIIPAYNAETTLRRCLDSLVGQVSDETEILLINDGSEDGTEGICREYAESCPQIRFVSKPNGGVSSARNVGLELANGEYILFVDADDAVREDYFAVLDKALETTPDMLFFRKRFMGICNCCSKEYLGGVTRDGVLPAAHFLSKCLRKQELNLITTKAFRREIIEKHGLRFDERLDIGEDKAFAFAFSLCSSNVKTISSELYYLSVDDPDSLSRRKRDHLCDSVMLEHRLMADRLKSADIPEDCKKRYRDALSYSFYRSAYTVVGELRKYDLTKTERIKKAREYLEAYSQETSLLPDELACKIIAFPVRKKDALLIDTVMRFSNK